MECMCAQTRPRFIVSSERVFREWSQNPCELQGKESPLPEAQRRIEPMTLYDAGQRAQHTNNELFQQRQSWSTSYTKKKKISISCIQETHLQSNKSFKVRDYQCFRSDRTDRSKEGVLTLVRNACLTDTHVEDSGHQVLKMQADTAGI